VAQRVGSQSRKASNEASHETVDKVDKVEVEKLRTVKILHNFLAYHCIFAQRLNRMSVQSTDYIIKPNGISPMQQAKAL
jgi:hypothetical protein